MKKYIAVTLFFFCFFSQAEPWLSNKVTQNCAACHSPGRINKQPKDRRCTLSCQGCHVNPNGGGIRNHYGKWNQERWLKSFSVKQWHGKALPAPTEEQDYAQLLNKWLGEGEDTSKRSRRYKRRLKRKKAKIKKKLVSHVFEMEESEKDFVDEKKFHDNDNPRWKIIAEDDDIFMSQVPLNDPYRLERSEPVIGGGDLRFLSLSIDRGDGSEKENYTWTMAADLGVRWKPVKEHVSAVIESRFLNSPQNGRIDDGFQSSQLRSAYILVDDMPYNTHGMIGMYRPMFGHYNPDHEGLIPDITGLDQRAIYKGIGFGLAPNVPYMTVHMLNPSSNTYVNQDRGFVVNVGGRFVTLGLSPQFSYWSTKKTDTSNPEQDLKKTMWSASIGGRWNRLIGVAELISIEEEFEPGLSDKGSAYWLELKYQLWREIYAVFNYGKSNIARTLKEGSGKEVMYGVKSFLLQGVELEVLLVQRDDTVGTTSSSSKSVQTQLHLFF